MPGTLHRELQQRRPFDRPEEEGYLAIIRTAELLRRRTAELLKGSGLTLAQYNVLRILRGAGKVGQLTGEIGARLVVQEPDVPRLLDRIEKKGWVSRTRQADDRRCVRVHLTRAGRLLVDGLDAPIHAMHRAQFSALGPAELRALVSALDGVRASIVASEIGDAS
jgi:DNA-binding MarR family transcriptional regulator